MISLSQFESHLSQHGKFCLIDWLIDHDHLPYAKYEAWRYGEEASLDTFINLDNDELSTLLSLINKHSGNLQLQNDAQEYFQWGQHKHTKLTASKDSTLNNQLIASWYRPQDLPQLDLFMDNAAVIAENNVRQALISRDFLEAEQAVSRLTTLNNGHTLLGGFQDLLNYGLHIDQQKLIDKSALDQELQGLKTEVAPLAREILGSQSRDYLAYAWRRLSNNLEGMAFCEANPERHRSFTLMQIPDWSALDTCLRQENHLFKHTVLLYRLCQCHGKLQQRSQALFAWCLLFELDKDFAETKINDNKGEAIERLWDDFWEIEEANTVDFFPAFILANNPGIIHLQNRFPDLSHPASQVMSQLLHQRINKEDETEQRKALQSISPVLLRMYLKSM